MLSASDSRNLSNTVLEKEAPALEEAFLGYIERSIAGEVNSGNDCVNIPLRMSALKTDKTYSYATVRHVQKRLEVKLRTAGYYVERYTTMFGESCLHVSWKYRWTVSRWLLYLLRLPFTLGE